jgi:hypothetical protein
MRRSASLRYALVLVALGIFFLLLTGFNFSKLPFTPGAEFSDAVTTHFSSALYLRDQALHGGDFLPLWRETIMGGQPFAANPLNKTAYPLQWLVVIFPPTQHLNILIVVHLLIAGAGMWRWTRALGLRREAAALSAIAYTLAPRMIGHLGAGHLDIVYALAWFPWLMDGARRFATKPHLHHAFLTAFFATLMLLADVRVSLFAFFATAVYGWSAAHGQRRRALGWSIFAVIIGLLLTASVLIPLIAYAPSLSRAALTAEEAGLFSLEPAQFLGLILPPQSGNVETLTYAGLPVLFLAAIALFSSPRKHAIWIGLLIFVVVWSLGVNSFIWNTLVRVFPPLLWFRVPSRAWLLVALILPLLAGYGLDGLCNRVAQLYAGQGWKRLGQARLWTLILLVICVTGGLFMLLALPMPPGMGLSLLLWGGGFALVMLLAFARRLPWRMFAGLILLISFGDLAMNGRVWLEWRGEDQWLTPYQPLAERLREDGVARVYSPTYSLPQQAAQAYDIEIFGGVDPFQIERASQAIIQGGGIDFEGYSVVMPPLVGMVGNDLSTANRDALPNTELLAAWGVSHIVAAYSIELEALAVVDVMPLQGRDVYIYRNLAYQPSDTVESASNAALLFDQPTLDRLNNLTVSSAVMSFVVFGACVVVLLVWGVRRMSLRRIDAS